jgi:hypothetical protein
MLDLTLLEASPRVRVVAGSPPTGAEAFLAFSLVRVTSPASSTVYAWV